MQILLIRMGQCTVKIGNQLAIKANALGFVDSQMLKNEALRWHKFQAAIEREFLRPEKSGLKWQ